jgi:hypothetical protein
MGGLGVNSSLGGFSAGPNPSTSAITPVNSIGFGANEETVKQGGYLWTIGAGATLRFGATEAAPIK